MQVGYLAPDGGYAISNANSGYMPELNAGDSITFAIQVQNAGFDENDFNIDCGDGGGSGNEDVNTAPQLVTASPLQATEDTTLNQTLVGSDAEGDPFTFSVLTDPTNGTYSLDGDVLMYTPNADFNGQDTIEIVVNDGALDSVPVTLEISVAPINDAPTAVSQNITLLENALINITLDGSDIDGDALQFTVVNPPANGTLGGTAPQLTYTANTGFSGSDAFTFRVSDGQVQSTDATVQLTITNVNDAPVVAALDLSTEEDTALSATLLGQDNDNDALTFSIFTPPVNGSYTIDGDTLTYTPNENYFGTDTLAIVANDGALDSLPVQIMITVTSANDVPMSNSLSIDLSENASVDITLDGSDADGDALQFTIIDQPANGTLSGVPPLVTYTPNPNFAGSDSFTYQVSDGLAQSNNATVGLSISDVNNAPVVSIFTLSTDEDVTVTESLVATDGDNDPVTFSVTAPPSHGSYSIDGANISYTPNEDYFGTDQLTLVASDGVLDSDPVEILISVTATNDAPVASDIDANTIAGLATQFQAVISDIDNEQDTLSVLVESQPLNGSVTVSDSLLIYTPAQGFVGEDTFTYLASDGSESSEPATATVTVAAPAVPEITYLGTDFWFMYTSNQFRETDLRVVVTSQNDAAGTLSIPGLELDMPFQVSANSATEIVLDSQTVFTMHTNKEHESIYGLHLVAGRWASACHPIRSEFQ